jgi:hypothetical protein
MSNSYQDMKKQIALYFDNELCQTDKSSLLSQVETDPKCCSMFEKEKNFREYIKNNIKRPSVSSDLISNIKNKLSTTF